MQEILLVDDDLGILHTSRDLLELEGMAVRCAESGKQALLELKEKSFHLMITDLNMPGMNGLELARKAAAIAPGMPIIMMTGDIPPEISRLAEASIAAVITKPCYPIEMLETIRLVAVKQR